MKTFYSLLVEMIAHRGLQMVIALASEILWRTRQNASDTGSVGLSARMMKPNRDKAPASTLFRATDAGARDFGLLFIVMLVTGAGNTALQSILPAIGRSLKVPDSVIATIFSVSALIWVFAAPYWARKSDQQGRKKMVLIGSVGFTVSITLVGVILYAGLSGWIGPLVTMAALILARLIYGTFGAAAPPAAQAMVALRSSREDRVKALTLLGSAFGLGTILGPALAPFLILPGVGLAGPAFIFAIVGLVLSVAVARYLNSIRQARRKWRMKACAAPT